MANQCIVLKVPGHYCTKVQRGSGMVITVSPQTLHYQYM
jgi:hypothetical protein